MTASAIRHLTSAVEEAGDRWLLGLTARVVFAGVLLLYYLNSWQTKLGEGVLGFVLPGDSAYYQIVPWAVDAAGGEVAAVGLLPRLIVMAGTIAELLLPLLVVAGLFTRLAALGMIVFIMVQSWVDIAFHGVDETTVGALFDRHSDALIADQRVLWVFLLLVLVLKGGGALALDALLPASRQRTTRSVVPAREAMS